MRARERERERCAVYVYEVVNENQYLVVVESIDEGDESPCLGLIEQGHLGDVL